MQKRNTAYCVPVCRALQTLRVSLCFGSIQGDYYYDNSGDPCPIPPQKPANNLLVYDFLRLLPLSYPLCCIHSCIYFLFSLSLSLSFWMLLFSGVAFKNRRVQIYSRVHCDTHSSTMLNSSSTRSLISTAQ